MTSVDRFLWLVAAPTAACFAAWAVFLVGTPAHQVAAHVVAGVLPLVGLLTALVPVALRREPFRGLPYFLLAVVEVVFAVSMVDLAMAISREPDGAFIPVLQYGLGFLLPFLAFAGGLLGIQPSSDRSAA